MFTAAGTNVYVNGNLVNTVNPVDFKPSTVTGQKLTIGITKDGTAADMEAFTGNIDDVRIWSTMRTQQEISNNRNTALTGTETGLVANYTFNSGNNAADNSGLKTAIDATPNNLHGVLTNFDLTNSTSNYVASAVVILPIHLTSFSAAKNGTTSLLSWTTASEQDFKSFIIESSADGKSFAPIGNVAAARNSNATTSYSFTDFKPLAGNNYYRLQLADADGKTSYSKTMVVKFPATAVISVSPNPASSSLHYTVSSLQTTKATVTIISATGQTVHTTTAAVQTGSNTLSLDISRLPAGNYTLQVLNTPAGVASSQQFTIAR
ncbi:MAG: T9SS type A sorting domain-containing protein [Hymenobacter sp.]|nr:MAG: T9SS type A sorting domain-containing protein [Hymenobacter sp.]